MFSRESRLDWTPPTPLERRPVPVLLSVHRVGDGVRVMVGVCIDECGQNFLERVIAPLYRHASNLIQCQILLLSEGKPMEFLCNSWTKFEEGATFLNSLWQYAGIGILILVGERGNWMNLNILRLVLLDAPFRWHDEKIEWSRRRRRRRAVDQMIHRTKRGYRSIGINSASMEGKVGGSGRQIEHRQWPAVLHTERPTIFYYAFIHLLVMDVHCKSS